MQRDARQSESAHATAERVARASYGKLLAHLATRWRDVAAAEDALSEAFAAALERWPREGVPQKPEAWMLAVARNKLTDAARATAVRKRPDIVAQVAGDAMEWNVMSADDVPDERLRLMLACAHPAIDAAVRPALILQVALGLEVRQMASAFLLSTDTLNKRLVRAKAKIKATNLRFEEPAPEDLGPRLHALLEANYAAYFIGREGALIDGDFNDELAAEAVYLSGVIASLLPSNPEAKGLRALLLFCEARRTAQRDAAGEFVPLLDQDTRLWDGALLQNAYELVGEAARLGTIGPFQLEAAIQAAHCYRARAGSTPWRDIAALYQSLVALHPTVGAMVGMAVATGEAHGATAGLTVLDTLEESLVRSYQPYWVARSHLLDKLGETSAAIQCLSRALGLTSHPRLRSYLQRRLATIKTALV